jgi:uncharacterized membrane protein YdjX (TVP38/TMEM64 family)
VLARSATPCSIRLLCVLLFLLLGLAVLLLLPFLFWGELFTLWFSGEAGLAWLRSWGAWGWLAVLALLVADLFLPLPSTAVMSGAGYLYGAWLGGLLSACGSFLSGLLAYGLCRRFGRALAARLAGADELARGEALFQRQGAWIVALSRWLPLLPEVVSCLAGLARMRFGVFALALACGSIPVGFAFAAIGATGHERPQLALALSAIVPVLLWLVMRRFIARS